VWRRRDPEPPLTWADAQAIVESLMRIESKLARILAILDDEDDEEEAEPDT
jgi:hypothetical protein